MVWGHNIFSFITPHSQLTIWGSIKSIDKQSAKATSWSNMIRACLQSEIWQFDRFVQIRYNATIRLKRKYRPNETIDCLDYFAIGTIVVLHLVDGASIAAENCCHLLLFILLSVIALISIKGCIFSPKWWSLIIYGSMLTSPMPLWLLLLYSPLLFSFDKAKVMKCAKWKFLRSFHFFYLISFLFFFVDLEKWRLYWTATTTAK